LTEIALIEKKMHIFSVFGLNLIYTECSVDVVMRQKRERGIFLNLNAATSARTASIAGSLIAVSQFRGTITSRHTPLAHSLPAVKIT
jgi:hypothetical protein